MSKRVLFVGHGSAGKDEACTHFAALTGLRNAGTCSLYLARHVARELYIPSDVAYARRRESAEMRTTWKRIGDEVRRDDPAKIVREMMAHGEVGGGLRGLTEVRATRAEGLVDLIVWVDRLGNPPDPTMEFGPEECDVVIQNHGDLASFHGKLEALARFAGLAPCPMCPKLADRIATCSEILGRRAEKPGA